MNDFNRGALEIPCLRLDYGFGEQWASVELGDGTGYVRLADYEKLREKCDYYKALWQHATFTDCELRRVRAAWKKDRDENAKLRDNAWRTVDRLSCENAKLRELVRKYGEYTSQDRCDGCVCKSRCNDGDVDECWQRTEIREMERGLGIGVDE